MNRKEQMTMETGRLGSLLDTTHLFRARVDELHEQQKRLFLESIGEMVALADLRVSVSSLKRRKGATGYFKPNDAEQCCGDGKENILAGCTVVGGAQSKSSCKPSAAKTRSRRKPLADSQAVNQCGQLETSAVCTRVFDGREPNEGVGFHLQGGRNDELIRSIDESKISSLPVKGNEELVHSVEEKKKCSAKSLSPPQVILPGEAEEAVQNRINTRASSGAVLIGGKSSSQVKTEVGDLDAPVLTRARARVLQNTGGNVTIARGEPPLKKRRGRKVKVNSSPPAEHDETAAKMPNVEQQGREEPPSSRTSLAVKKRNTRANSRSPAAETDGNVGKSGACGEEQHMEAMKLEIPSPNTSRRPKAERREEEEEQQQEEMISKGRPSKKSRTSPRDTRLNANAHAAEADAFEIGKAEDASAIEHPLPNAQTSVQEYRSRGRSSTKKSRDWDGNTAAGEIDRSSGKSERVLANENESTHFTAQGQPRTSSIKGVVAAVFPLPAHTNVSTCDVTSEGDTLHSMGKRDEMNATPAEDTVMPPAQDGNGSDLNVIPSNSVAKTTQMDVPVPEGVKWLRDGGDPGSEPSSVLSSPSPRRKSVEREAGKLVLSHLELKDEDTSSASEVPEEECQADEENGALRKGHSRSSSDSLAETDESTDRTRRSLAQSVEECSLAVELETKKIAMGAIETGGADLQSSVVNHVTGVDRTHDGMQFLSAGDSMEASISPRNREFGVDQGGFHCSPAAASDRRLTEQVTKAEELHGEELLDKVKIIIEGDHPSCERREEADMCGGRMPIDSLPDRGGCALSPPVQDCQEVSSYVRLLEQASRPSKELGRFHMGGVVPVDHAVPPSTTAQYGSELRLTRLMSKKHVSFAVADVAGEGGKYYAPRMKAGRLQDAREEGLVCGSGRKETDHQQPQWACNKLELVDTSANKLTPCSVEESSVVLQNKETRDLLLELWKREGMQRSCLTTAHEGGGASSSEVPGSKYTVDVIDEVYRSVVVRECGENGAVSSLTLPVANWRSENVRNMNEAPSQCWAGVRERNLPLSDGPRAREVTEIECLEDRKSEGGERIKPYVIQEQVQEEERKKPYSFVNREQVQEDETSEPYSNVVQQMMKPSSFVIQKQVQEEERMKAYSNVIQKQVQEEERKEAYSNVIQRQVEEEERIKPSLIVIQKQVQEEERMKAYSNVIQQQVQEEERMKPSSILIQEQVREERMKSSSSEIQEPEQEQEEDLMKPYSILIQEQEQEEEQEDQEDEQEDEEEEEEIVKPYLVLIQGQEQVKEEEMTKPSSVLFQEQVQEEEITKAHSILLQEQMQEQEMGLGTPDSVSAIANSGVVECSQEIDTDHELSIGSEQLLSHEDLNVSKPIFLSRVEEEPEVSNFEGRPEHEVSVEVPNPSHDPVKSVDVLQQLASSKIGDAQLKRSSNLVASVKSFVPVCQAPPPSFLPDGKRVVQVKALKVAEAARRAEESGDSKARVKRMRRVEENAMEKDRPAEATARPVEGSSKLDGESSCGSQLSPKKKVLLRDRSNSRHLFSPEAKSKQATHLEMEMKVKRNQAELKRVEEERKRKLLAMRQNKEELAKKNRQRHEVLKQRKDQNRLVVEPEEKGQQRHQVPEDADRERKDVEEKLKQCTPRPREKENRQGEELKEKGAAGQGALGRPGLTPAAIRANVLGPGTLFLRSAVRVPVMPKDKRTPGTVAAAMQKKGQGRHPSSSSSSSRLQSLNAAEPARVSSLNNAESADGGLHNSARAFSFSNNKRLTEVQQGGAGDSLSYGGTPCSEAGEKQEDVGPMSYEISPYRESSDEEEDEKEQQNKAAKHIPFWARSEYLHPHLVQQLTLDPDDIFTGSMTCSLKEVFGTTGSKKIQDFGKRSGSGDWFEDRVSWKEELQYKINMGFMQDKYSP